MRAVVDVNVLVSSVLSRSGAPARLISAWLDGAFEMVVSPMLLDELRRVLAYPKIRTRIPEVDAEQLIVLLGRALAREDPLTGPNVEITDPDDAYLVALAATERAVLVTGDRGLLALADRIPVMAPGDFLIWLESQQPN